MDEDLYGDLTETKPAPTGATTSDEQSRQTKKSKKAVHHPGSLASTVERLEQQLEGTQKENEILRRNIGILYRTAKSEIERKDREIESLMKELEGTTKS